MTVFSVENFLRERFFRDHGHLISPWNYGPAAVKACNENLLRRNWLYWQKKREEIALLASKPVAEWLEKMRFPVDKPPV